MIIIIAEEGKKIHLGRVGENEARAVRFDISRIQAEFPGATFSVLNMRPQDPDAYPVNGQYIRIEGNYLYWTLQSGDLAEDGLGQCELKATLNGAIVKSIIWTTEICPALDGNGTPPEPWESWQQQVEDDADRAEAAAELLEHPGAEAETLTAGSQATAAYSDGVFTFGIPKGDTGEDGYSPTVRMNRGTKRLNIYITDKNGTKSSYVDDGKDGRKLAMGSVQTLETGEPATAEIIDNPQWPEMYLNLGLPKGNTGDQGEQGETGETPIISIGTVTTLPAGSSATASMDTTDPEHPVLSMGIPKGDPGEVTEEELEEATTELKSQINKFDYYPTLTSSDVVADYYVRGDTGQVVSSSNYVCTDFVEIPSGSVGLKLTANCYFGSTVGWAFYSSKSVNAFVDGGTGSGWTTKSITTTIPATAKYFRTTLLKSGYSTPSDFGINYQIMITDLKKGVDDLYADVSGIHTDLTADETAIGKNANAVRKIPTWSNGTIDSSGNIYARTDRINTGLMEADVASIKCINNYYGLIAYYDEDKTFKSITSFTQGFSVDKSSFPSGTYYIAIAIHNGTGSIDPSEGTNCVILYSMDDVIKGTYNPTETETPFIEGSKNQIARLGWDVYNPNNPPEQTIESYTLAYKNGCRIMLADVRVTSDGKFVLWHDDTLNNNVRHTDGSTLSTDEKATTIAGSTLAELNVYDYGYFRGSAYEGKKIPMLEDLLKWCSLTNCIPMLEIKVQLTETDCNAIATMCKQYGLGDRVIIDEYYAYLQNTVGYWKASLPKCKLCIIAWGDVWTAKNFINSNLASTDIEVLLTISSTSQLYLISTDDNIDYSKVKIVTDVGAKLTYTEVANSSAMESLYDAGYIDVFSYIASSYINVNAWLRDELGLL